MRGEELLGGNVLQLDHIAELDRVDAFAPRERLEILRVLLLL
jgi:hypothetical protein